MLHIEQQERKHRESLGRALNASLENLNKFLAPARASITDNNPAIHIILIWQDLQMDPILCVASPLSYQNEHSPQSIKIASFQKSQAKLLISAFLCAWLLSWTNISCICLRTLASSSLSRIRTGKWLKIYTLAITIEMHCTQDQMQNSFSSKPSFAGGK